MTVDPRDKGSTKVIQLETAMGAAISAFEGAIALRIPRSRFAPVKKCDDLVALRSDAYVITEDSRIELAGERAGVPPTIKLDDAYKFCDAMETLILEAKYLTSKSESSLSLFSVGFTCDCIAVVFS